MLKDKLIDKYKSSDNLKYFQDKLIKHFNRQQLNFGNKISSSFKNIIYLIDDVLNDTENYNQCEYCNKIIFEGDLINVDNNKICEDCYSEYYTCCENCGENIHREDVYILFDCECYCKECYFDVLESEYSKHKINSKILQELEEKIYPIIWDKIKEVEIKIDGYNWSIEKHNGYYRLGSWSANCWIDIGSNINNVIKAIDYQLRDNFNKVESFDLQDSSVLQS